MAVKQVNKLLGRCISKSMCERNFNQDIDTQISQNPQTYLFAADAAWGSQGINDGPRMIRKGKNKCRAMNTPCPFDCCADDLLVSNMQSVKHAKCNDDIFVF